MRNGSNMLLRKIPPHLGLALLMLLPGTFATAKKTVAELLSQAQHESRGSGVVVSTLKKASTQLPESQLGFQQKSKMNFDSIKPPKSSELMREDNTDRGQYEKVLDQQIQELFKLTQKFKNSRNRGELWLRLAELYVEKAALVDNRAQNEYDARIKAYNEHKIKTKPVLNVSSAREYNRKAIKLYEWFEKDFPQDSKMSQALFFLGYNYFELGNSKKGASYYERLNKQFPNSPFVGESHFALGEYYFEGEKWKPAYKEYSNLIKAKKHRLHSFALYKGAWCLYRMGEYKQALRYIEYIIKTSREQASRKSDKSRLENEAMRDLVVFYAAEGDPQRAKAYFINLLQTDDVHSYVEKLAYYLSDKGNKEGSRILFKQMIADAPNSPKAYEYQYQIVQNYFYTKNSPQFKEELYRWIKDYGQNSSWYNFNQANKELLDSAYKLRETTLRNWVLQQHQAAQNSRAPFSQMQATEGYNLYLQEFSQSAMVADMHFYFGELLYDTGKFDEAGIQYRWVIDNSPKSKYYDRAGTNLIHAADKSVPKDQELQKRIGNSVEPIPLDPRVERFIKAGQWHMEKFPNSAKNPEVKFRIGRLYYLHNQFDEANKYFQGIVKNHPGSKYAEYSANLMLDIFSLKKDYVGLEKTGNELLAIPSIASSKAGGEIRGVLEKANFKRAQDLEIDKKYAESATQFELFAKQNPKSNLAGVAWFNAGVNFERTAQNRSAILAYDQVLNSQTAEVKTLKPKAKRLLAKLYQDAAQFEMSARLYKESAQENPNDPLAANYIFNAAVFKEALGRLDEAAKLYKEYLQMVKRNSDKQDALWALAQIYRRSNNSSATIESFKDYLELNPSDPNKTVEANYWVYFYLNRGHKSDADTWKTKTLAVQKRLARSDKSIGNQYAARIKLEDAKTLSAKYTSIRIPANPQKQKKAVDEKIDLLSQLTKLLNEVTKYESAEEVVTSLSILGEANYHMSQAILNTPLPSGLNAEEKKAYEDGIGKIADPFLQKAKEAFKAAVDRGFELEVYNEGFRKSREFIAQGDPNSYYDMGEIGFETRFMNWIQ